MLSVSAYGQSRTVEEFRQQYTPRQTFFFYKSTLRMFARVSTQFAETDGAEIPDLGKLIDGIEKAKLFIYSPTDSDKQTFIDLRSEIGDEGYVSEIEVFMKEDDFRMNLMVKPGRGGSDVPSGYVILGLVEGELMLLDIEGSPDLGNLYQFSNYMLDTGNDFSWLTGLR